MGSSWITALLNLILPRHARAERAAAVSEAELRARYAPGTLPRLTWIHTLFPYRDERIRDMIQALKYYNEGSVVEKLAPFVADFVTELVDHKTRFEGWRDVRLVPIPASDARRRARGYCQAERVARAAAARVPDVRLDTSLLMRAERVSQVHVPRAMRKLNIREAFTAAHGAHSTFIILLDDVVESGATLLDARRALLDEGARGVAAVVLAH